MKMSPWPPWACAVRIVRGGGDVGVAASAELPSALTAPARRIAMAASETLSNRWCPLRCMCEEGNPGMAVVPFRRWTLVIGLGLMEQILQLRSPSLVGPEGDGGQVKRGAWPGRSRAMHEGRRPDERPRFGCCYAGTRPWGDIVQPRSRPESQPRDDPEGR